MPVTKNGGAITNIIILSDVLKPRLLANKIKKMKKNYSINNKY
jgi:hypothetical protein